MQIAKAKNLIMHLSSLVALTMAKKSLLGHPCLSIIILILVVVACALFS